MADLEKTSESISAAGLFQVRQQESKAGEQGMYRKSGKCVGLRKAAGRTFTATRALKLAWLRWPATSTARQACGSVSSTP